MMPDSDDPSREAVAFGKFTINVGRLDHCVVLQVQWPEHPEPRCFLMPPDLAEDVAQSIGAALKAIANRPTAIN